MSNVVESFMYNNNLHYMTCAEFTDLTNREKLLDDILNQISDIVNLYPGSTITEVKNFLIESVNVGYQNLLEMANTGIIKGLPDKVILKKHFYKLVYLEKKLNELQNLGVENNKFVSIIPNQPPTYPFSVEGTYDCDEDNSISKNTLKQINKNDITIILDNVNNIGVGDHIYIGEEKHIINLINENMVILTKPIKNNYPNNTRVIINNFVLTNNNSSPICKNLKTGEEKPVKVICPQNFKSLDNIRCYNA